MNSNYYKGRVYCKVHFRFGFTIKNKSLNRLKAKVQSLENYGTNVLSRIFLSTKVLHWTDSHSNIHRRLPRSVCEARKSSGSISKTSTLLRILNTYFPNSVVEGSNRNSTTEDLFFF